VRRSFDEQTLARFWAKVEKSDGCWEWAGARMPWGYGNFTANGRTIGAHRFSYEAFVGDLKPGMFVCHRCDNPRCVRPSHLFLGTCKDNVDDMLRKGRHVSRTGNESGSRRHPKRRPRGEEHKTAKLTAVKVQQIRRLRNEGATQHALAKTFGVSRGAILAVLSGRTWRHVS